MAEPRVIGIDPSLRATGLAWKGGSGWWTYVVPGDGSQILSVLDIARHQGVNIAYIEAGYVGPNRKVSIQLAELRGRIQQRCLNLGIEYVMVDPKDWQTAMLGTIPTLRVDRWYVPYLGPMPKKIGKTCSILLAQRLGANVTGPNGKSSDDIADATVIAEYGRLQERLTS